MNRYSHPNFVLLSVPRSGSTWLQHCLDSHPDASCIGEVFSIHTPNCVLSRLMPSSLQKLHREINNLHIKAKLPWRFFTRILNRSLGYLQFFLNAKRLDQVLKEGIIPSSYANSKIRGFKVMRFHLMRFKPSLEKYLSENCEFKLILLRRNLLQRWVSIMVAKKKVNFASSSGSVSKQKYKLPMKNLLRDLSSLKKAQDDVLNYKIAKNKLIIYYEDLLFNPSQTWNQICRFLQISTVPLPETNCVKQNSLKISDTVSNFEELKSLLLNSEFQCYLDL